VKIRIYALTVCGLFGMMGGLTACNQLTKGFSEGSSKNDKLSSNNPKTDVSKKIYGQWKDPSRSDTSASAIGFSDTGVLYSFKEENGKSVAAELGSYRLDSTQNPMRLELEVEGEKRTTLIEFLDSGEMRLIELSRLDPEKPLPLSMPEYATRLKKVSDVATVPNGMLPKIQRPKISQQDIEKQHVKAIQSESKQLVGAMSRSTQAFFLENAKLPTALSQLGYLGSGLKPESENYRYEVKLLDNKSVQLLGLSKLPEVKGYTGGVFVISSGSEQSTNMIICEAANPGVGDLPAPKLVNNEPTCSEGTVSLSLTTKAETPTQSTPQNIKSSSNPSDMSGFNAEIFAPPSNCRSAPNETASVQKILDKGDVLVDKDSSQKNEKGESWYQEKYLGCWIHQSQLRFK
jgi:hypothetical protein